MQVKKQQLDPDMEEQTGSKLGKEYVKAVYCHPTYLTYMRNAGLDEAQAGIKIAGRNLINLRCAGETNLMAERKEKLKSLLMKVKQGEKKASLKLNIKKIKSSVITHGKQMEETMQTVTNFIFLGSNITADGD